MADSTYRTQAANVPSIIVGDGSTGVTILSYNRSRLGLHIQNVGTTTAYILIDGQQSGNRASSTVYHYAVKGGTGDGDGTGGSIDLFDNVCPSGLITMYGASTAKVVALELGV